MKRVPNNGDYYTFKPWLIKTPENSVTYQIHGFNPMMRHLIEELEAFKITTLHRNNKTFRFKGYVWSIDDFIPAPESVIKKLRKHHISSKTPKWWRDEFDLPHVCGNYNTRWLLYNRKRGFYNYHTYWQIGNCNTSYSCLKDGAPNIKFIGEDSTACFAQLGATIRRYRHKYKTYAHKVTYLRATPHRNAAEDMCYQYYQLMKKHGVLPPYFNSKRMAYEYNAGFDFTHLTMNQLFAMLAVSRIPSEKPTYMHVLLWLLNKKKMQDFWIALFIAAKISNTTGHHFISYRSFVPYPRHYAAPENDNKNTNKIIIAALGYRDFFQQIDHENGKSDLFEDTLPLRNNYTDEVQKLSKKYKIKTKYQIKDLLTLKLEDVK